MTTLILTDNTFALGFASELAALHGGIEIRQSPRGVLENIPRLNVKTQVNEILQRYNLVVSVHCKQLFPPALVNGVRCVNVHPGFNPFNRGWYPQVFSIINGQKAGVTIHEIDDQLDHGPIIAQREYSIRPWDTSGSAYANIMMIERELLLEHFRAIRDNTYRAVRPSEEGNVNLKVDFEAMRHLDLERQGKFGDFLNHLRALTHEGHNNAYFTDRLGRKVFVRLALEPEERQPGA